jgi:hypothetical protein
VLGTLLPRARHPGSIASCCPPRYAFPSSSSIDF